MASLRLKHWFASVAPGPNSSALAIWFYGLEDRLDSRDPSPPLALQLVDRVARDQFKSTLGGQPLVVQLVGDYDARRAKAAGVLDAYRRSFESGISEHLDFLLLAARTDPPHSLNLAAAFPPPAPRDALQAALTGNDRLPDSLFDLGTGYHPPHEALKSREELALDLRRARRRAIKGKQRADDVELGWVPLPDRDEGYVQGEAEVEGEVEREGAGEDVHMHDLASAELVSVSGYNDGATAATAPEAVQPAPGEPATAAPRAVSAATAKPLSPVPAPTSPTLPSAPIVASAPRPSSPSTLRIPRPRPSLAASLFAFFRRPASRAPPSVDPDGGAASASAVGAVEEALARALADALAGEGFAGVAHAAGPAKAGPASDGASGEATRVAAPGRDGSEDALQRIVDEVEGGGAGGRAVEEGEGGVAVDDAAMEVTEPMELMVGADGEAPHSLKGVDSAVTGGGALASSEDVAPHADVEMAGVETVEIRATADLEDRGLEKAEDRVEVDVDVEQTAAVTTTTYDSAAHLSPPPPSSSRQSSPAFPFPASSGGFSSLFNAASDDEDGGDTSGDLTAQAISEFVERDLASSVADEDEFVREQLLPAGLPLAAGPSAQSVSASLSPRHAEQPALAAAASPPEPRQALTARPPPSSSPAPDWREPDQVEHSEGPPHEGAAATLTDAAPAELDAALETPAPPFSEGRDPTTPAVETASAAHELGRAAAPGAPVSLAEEAAREEAQEVTTMEVVTTTEVQEVTALDNEPRASLPPVGEAEAVVSTLDAAASGETVNRGGVDELDLDAPARSQALVEAAPSPQSDSRHSLSPVTRDEAVQAAAPEPPVAREEAPDDSPAEGVVRETVEDVAETVAKELIATAVGDAVEPIAGGAIGDAVAEVASDVAGGLVGEVVSEVVDAAAAVIDSLAEETAGSASPRRERSPDQHAATVAAPSPGRPTQDASRSPSQQDFVYLPPEESKDSMADGPSRPEYGSVLSHAFGQVETLGDVSSNVFQEAEPRPIPLEPAAATNPFAPPPAREQPEVPTGDPGASSGVLAALAALRTEPTPAYVFGDSASPTARSASPPSAHDVFGPVISSQPRRSTAVASMRLFRERATESRSPSTSPERAAKLESPVASLGPVESTETVVAPVNAPEASVAPVDKPSPRKRGRLIFDGVEIPIIRRTRSPTKPRDSPVVPSGAARPLPATSKAGQVQLKPAFRSASPPPPSKAKPESARTDEQSSWLNTPARTSRAGPRKYGTSSRAPVTDSDGSDDPLANEPRRTSGGMRASRAASHPERAESEDDDADEAEVAMSLLSPRKEGRTRELNEPTVQPASDEADEDSDPPVQHTASRARSARPRKRAIPSSSPPAPFPVKKPRRVTPAAPPPDAPPARKPSLAGKRRPSTAAGKTPRARASLPPATPAPPLRAARATPSSSTRPSRSRKPAEGWWDLSRGLQAAEATSVRKRARESDEEDEKEREEPQPTRAKAPRRKVPRAAQRVVAAPQGQPAPAFDPVDGEDAAEEGDPTQDPPSHRSPSPASTPEPEPQPEPAARKGPGKKRRKHKSIIMPRFKSRKRASNASVTASQASPAPPRPTKKVAAAQSRASGVKAARRGGQKGRARVREQESTEEEEDEEDDDWAASRMGESEGGGAFSD